MEKTLKDFLAFGKIYDEKSIKELNSLALAYVGDAVFELLVRTMVLKGNIPAHKLHTKSIKYVQAKGQKELIEKVLQSLSEEELGVYNRGKNSKPHTIAKNQTLSDYMEATGLEALFGYLYLLDRLDRLVEIFGEMIN